MLYLDNQLSFDDFKCNLANFVVYPLLVMISADTDTVGITILDEEKKEENPSIPILSKAIGLNMVVMKSVFKLKE